MFHFPRIFPIYLTGCVGFAHMCDASHGFAGGRAALSSRQSAHQSKPGDSIAKLSSVVHKVLNSSGCLDIKGPTDPEYYKPKLTLYYKPALPDQALQVGTNYKCELTITSVHCSDFGIAFSMPQAPKCGALWSVNKLHAGSRGIASCREF